MKPGPTDTRARIEREAANIYEEIANVLVHTVGAVLAGAALALFVVLASFTDSARVVAACVIYGASVFLSLFFAALYHGIWHAPTKAVFMLLDHVSIFALIAGAYTPIALLALPQPIGEHLFWTIWALAGLGAGLRLWLGRLHGVLIPVFLAMGWLSRRVECTPSSDHVKSPFVGSFGARITTGAPLIPRCVRASVMKYPFPSKRSPNEEATIARRATGMWRKRSWRPRKTDDQNVGADLARVGVDDLVGRLERPECYGRRQRVLLDFNRSDVDRSATVACVPPQAHALPVKRDREVDAAGDIAAVDVKLDLNSVGPMLALLVEEYMPACPKEKARTRRWKKPLAFVNGAARPGMSVSASPSLRAVQVSVLRGQSSQRQLFMGLTARGRLRRRLEGLSQSGQRRSSDKAPVSCAWQPRQRSVLSGDRWGCGTFGPRAILSFTSRAPCWKRPQFPRAPPCAV